ncbi:MAG TPA: PQQ-dependent dehydrogenase, methanol/ethanol family, partial [Gammaproteobacteria bacterium]
MTKRSWVMPVAALLPLTAAASDEVQRLTEDESNWAIWGGNYAGMRYSPLDQIDRDNVRNLQPAWTFSTGVLRGHEGGPLVLGD